MTIGGLLEHVRFYDIFFLHHLIFVMLTASAPSVTVPENALTLSYETIINQK